MKQASSWFRNLERRGKRSTVEGLQRRESAAALWTGLKTTQFWDSTREEMSYVLLELGEE